MRKLGKAGSNLLKLGHRKRCNTPSCGERFRPNTKHSESQELGQRKGNHRDKSSSNVSYTGIITSNKGPRDVGNCPEHEKQSCP